MSLQVGNMRKVTDNSASDTIANRSIFKSSAIDQVEGDDRFVFTTDNGRKCVQLDTSNNTLRWGNISSDVYSSMQIKTPSFNGNITDVIISDSGKSLCCYTKKDICLIEIPWTIKTAAEKSYLFQEEVPNLHEDGIGIKKALFHPKAAKDSCIVILFEDDTIWLYDTNSKSHIALNDTKRKLGVDDRVTSIQDISFSQDGLTLYILNSEEGGDIYALYPCLPERILLDQSELATLMHKSILLYDAVTSETPADVKRCIIKQTQFASELDLQFKEVNSHEGIPVNEHYRYTIPQGPFTVAPFPERLYEATALELTTINIDRDNELLAMKYDDNTLLFLFKDLELIMVWDVSGFCQNDSFQLIEELTMDTKDSTKIIKSYNASGTLLIESSHNAYIIDTLDWSSLISKAIKSADASLLQDVEFKSKIISLNIHDKITSAGVWNYRNTQGFVLASYKKVYIRNLGTERGNVGFNVTDEIDINKKIENKDEENYEVNFAQPIYEIMELNKNYQEECRFAFDEIVSPEDRQMPLHNPSNEKQLEILNKVSASLIEKIIRGQSLGVTFHSTLLAQQYELGRQLKYAANIIDKNNTLTDNLARSKKRFDENVTKQNELISRFNKLNEALNKIESSDRFKEIAISKQEIEWFKEIRNQAVKFNSFVRKQNVVNDTIKVIEKELHKLDLESRDLQKHDLDEWTSLQDMLKEDAVLLGNNNHIDESNNVAV